MPDELTSAELEEKMRRALADPGAVLEFYRALVSTTVYVIGTAHGEDQYAPTRFEAEGKSIYPVFTSRQRCEGYLTSGKCYATDLRPMLAGLPAGSHVLVNPDDPGHSYVFNDLLVAALSSGTIFQVDEKSFNGAFYTGPWREPKAALKKLLRDVLRRYDNVEAAFLTALFEPASPYPPHPAIGIAGRDVMAAIQESKTAIDRATGERASIYGIDRDDLSQYAVRNTAPFYRRTPPVQLPDPLAADEIVRFLQALSDDPVMVNSLLKLYLNSGMDAQEAAALWPALEERQRRRFKTLDAYTEWYIASKKEERQRYQAASTHSEARRVLLEALTKDGRFCLYLHDFGGEAAQSLEDTPNPEVKRVRWLSLPMRAVDEPLRRFFQSISMPAIGVSNPREAVRLWPVVPFLELEDSEWLRVVVSLISMAALIVLSVENTGPGLQNELFAIQKFSREDHTFILIPDEAAEKERRKLLDMLAATGDVIPRSAEPVASKLRNRLSTYGMVSTWAEFAKIADRFGKGEGTK
ncbi:MAG TPA: enhanced serine sensitivity protein SseB C-terminal domain-containing protein [Bryobacteraceae bacterium]|nr:enhanced serine sensitivity protein SseB C-terminal domain-containing protein [Bryobacteraceae bacterium]